MSRLVRRLVVALLALLALAPAAAAQAPARSARSEAFNRRIVDELRARDPAAADRFVAANAALDRHDLAAAVEGYRDVQARAPDFDHAVRRECNALSEQGSHDRAIETCRRALALSNSGENRAALAMALAAGAVGSARESSLREARTQAEVATGRSPDDDFSWMTLLLVGQMQRDVDAVARAGTRLRVVAPANPAGWYAGAVAAASGGDLDGARSFLDAARARGLAQAEYERFSGLLDAARPLPVRVLSTAGPWFVGWLAALALLLAAGAVLSGMTLAATRDVSGPEPTAGERAVRRLYRFVVGATSAYFFASIPMLALVMTVLGAGVVIALLAVGHIPIKLLAVVVVVTLVTLWGLLRAAWNVFVVRDEDPGLGLNLGEHPRLRALLDDVAGVVRTRPVDDVYVTAGTDLAVFERGGLWKRLTGRPRRCLVLGVGVLEGFDTGPLRAVLAHEYGHFANEDTAGGDVALAARRAIHVLAVSLITGGVAAWYNPVWWFVRGFNKVFLRVSHGASRLQEVLADRRAVQAYGSDAFADGLRHVIERSVRFDHHVGAALKEVIDEKRALANLYGYRPSAAPDADAVQRDIDTALAHPESPYDSHPVPAERIARARAQAVVVPPPADAAEPAWALLADREGLERRLTDQLRERISAEHGVMIPTEAAEAPAAGQGYPLD
jgi:Zn-dependent protease with chaperone function